MAMFSVIVFDAWRYFPFAYLFILARLQAVPKPLYESARVDGAGIVRCFFAITLPQLRVVIATIFTLRFIWTFNRFDDIFLLTGGAAGTKTLPIQVYDNAIGRGDIGAGAASAGVLFLLLAIFLAFWLQIAEKAGDEE
jgi:multiple sugar transport system permease protein